METWKDIKGYEGSYQVSDLGNVRSLDRLVKHPLGGNKLLKGFVMKQSAIPSGYMTVGLHFNGKRKTHSTHQLVATAFLNYKKEGYLIVVDHIDDNNQNNLLSNLQVISQRENCIKGKKNGTSKYTGVSWYKSRKEWVSKIQKNGKNIHIGYFKSELEAYEAYKKELNK